MVTFNVIGLNSPIKRHKVAEWIKNKTQLYAACKRLTSALRTHTDWKWRDGFYASGKQKRAWIAVLISDKIDFKSKTVTGDREVFM